MARQLKTFLRNRKAEMLGCGPCECRTLQCWRYANENCGCGESKSSLPNKFRVRENSENVFITSFFNEDVEQDNTISLESRDPETGDIFVVVGEFGFIEDEEVNMLWREMWESLDGECVGKLLGRYEEGGAWVGQFTSEAMAQFNAFFNNPTDEQHESLKLRLEDNCDNDYSIVTKTSITLSSDSWTVNTREQIVIEAEVNPSDESITAVSSDPSILRVNSVKKRTESGTSVYSITCTGVAAGTATITATCVNNPSVSAITPTIRVIGSGGGVNSISTHINTVSINETRFMSVEVVVDPYTAPDVSFTAVSSDPNVLEIENIIMYDEPTEWAVGHINVHGVSQGQCNLIITSVANPNATVTIPVHVGENISVETATPSSNSFTIEPEVFDRPIVLTNWYVDITPTNATNINDDVNFWNDENALGWAWISDISAEGRLTYTFNPVKDGTADYILQCGENRQTISVTVAHRGR